MFRRLFNFHSKTIFGAAFVLGAASLVSRLLGVIRDRILAGRFGAGDELDVYYAAFRIPDLVFTLFALGAISAGFIPVFVGYLKKQRDKAWYLASNVLNLMGLSLVLLCAVLSFLTPWLMRAVAPGFSSQKLGLTIELARVMFLSPLFLGLSAVLGGVLQSFKRFFAYSLAPILYNLGIIFGAVFLVDYFGLLGLAYGVVIGAFSHLVSQLVLAFSCGLKWRFVLEPGFEGMRRIVRLMPFRTLGLALTQVSFWVMTVLASYMAAGSIAVFNLSYNIWSFPYSILGISFAVAAFPHLSESAQRNDRVSFLKTFSKTFKQILFFTLPAAVLFMVLSAQIVQVVLKTGHFSPEDVLLTSRTLVYLSLSLFAESLILLLLRSFFAHEDAKRPFLIGLVSTAVRLGFAWYLAGFLGVAGLALGFSLGSFVYLLLLFIFFYRKLGFFDGQDMFRAGLRIFLASVLAGFTAYLCLGLVGVSDNAWQAFCRSLLAGLAGILVYLLSLRAMGLQHLERWLRFPWQNGTKTD